MKRSGLWTFWWVPDSEDGCLSNARRGGRSVWAQDRKYAMACCSMTGSLLLDHVHIGMHGFPHVQPPPVNTGHDGAAIETVQASNLGIGMQPQCRVDRGLDENGRRRQSTFSHAFCAVLALQSSLGHVDQQQFPTVHSRATVGAGRRPRS